MKRYIIAVLALIAFCGFAAKALADTNKLPSADGWTKITTLPSASDIANNYYVIVDNSQDLMLTIAKGSHNNGKWYSLSLWYQTSVLPTTSAILSKLWILQKGSYGDGSYALQNVEYPARLLQTENNKAYFMETNDVSTPNDWSKLNFAYSNGYWTIENGQYPASSSASYKGYLGPWEETEAINIPNNRELAGNKLGDYIGRFQIYAISKTMFIENYLAAASSSNPVDVSFYYVTNPTLDLNIDGWTRSATSLGGNASANYCTETLHSSTDFKFYQDVTSLPEGAYQVSAQARSETSSGAVYVTVNGNTLSTAVNTTTSSSSMQTEASTMLDRTTGKITTPTISLDNGQTLTLGFMDNVANHWDVFDNFKLYYMGNDLTTYENARNEVKEVAENAIASNLVTDACENAIQTAINTYGGDYSTKAEYITAQNAIQTALDTYFTNDIKSAYAAYKAFRTEVQALENTSTYNYNDPGTAKSAFDGAISSANTAVEAATTAPVINTQTANIRASALTFISSVIAEEGNPFNITFLASQDYRDWKKSDGSAACVVDDQDLTNRPNSIPPFAESNETTCETTGAVLYQTIEDLPAGYYQVGMYAAAMYTLGQGFNTGATEGDDNRTYAFAGDLYPPGSLQRTGIPISFASSRDFNELTALDVNVHMSNTGDLTFGVWKDFNGSNWHFAQIAKIFYSSTPDLTDLKATRDALVSEATGLKNGANANYLTNTQKSALQDAINYGEAADDFDELNDITMITLPNAIEIAKMQIQQVKASRAQVITALGRFENNYNQADGTDYSYVTMSEKAWTDLLAAVNNVTTALNNVSQASSYGTLKDALAAQMEATALSLRLFKSYKAMVEGCTALGIVGSYGDSANMASDAAEQTAIAALNTAFGTYASAQTADFNVGAFLGSNLDFSAAQGSALNTENGNSIYEVSGWEVDYSDADTWRILENQYSGYANQLYIRANWGSAATILTASKQKMLPVGKYKLSFSWNSNMQNMTNFSCYKLGDETVEIGEATNAPKMLTYVFDVVGEPKTFDLTFGFQKKGEGSSPAQIIVDNVTLMTDNTINMTANLASGAYWTTFYSDEGNYQAPEGTQVFTVNLTGTTLTLNEITDRIVKSGEGVVLKQSTTSSNTTTTIPMTLTNATPTGDFSGNSLTGTMTSITNPGNAYVLGGKNGAGFYKLSANGTIGANKAYLIYSGASAKEYFCFEEDATRVANVNVNDNDNCYYDLQGRCVSNGQSSIVNRQSLKKGIYIVNGKKTVIK